MEEAIPTMRRALTMLAGGDVVMPLRSYLALPGGDAVMGLMPSYMGGLEAVGVKVVAAFPANFGTEYDTHQGVVLFFDTERGLLRAIVDATSITAIRTAAVSGLVTDLLAKRRTPATSRSSAPARRRTRTCRRCAPCGPFAGYACTACRPSSAAEFAEREARLHRLAGRGGRDGRGGCRRRRPHLHDDDVHGARRARRVGGAGCTRQRRRRVHAAPRASSTQRSWPRRGCTPTSASRC